MSSNWRYSLRWTNESGDAWFEDMSFHCVADAKAHALANPPAGATHFAVQNTETKKDRIVRALNGVD